MMLAKRLIVTLLILVFPLPGFADEGMWLPHQVKELDLETRGLKMNPANLYRKDGTGLMSAVVRMNGSTGHLSVKRG